MHRGMVSRKIRWKIRRVWGRLRAPWPIVGECHSGHLYNHSCSQCDGSHEHVWRAWPKAPRWVTSGPGIPIRCTRCGGRKCDAAGCTQQRHGHTHWDEAEAPR